MTKRINDVGTSTEALVNSNHPVGGVDGTKINAAGFSRVRIMFQFGANSGTTAALSSGLGLYQASTSGATFALVTSLAAVTSGVLCRQVMVIDAPIASASPWIKVSGGSILSTAIQASAVATLYTPVSRPPTALEQQVVVA
jgi:hypothetical protein